MYVMLSTLHLKYVHLFDHLLHYCCCEMGLNNMEKMYGGFRCQSLIGWSVPVGDVEYLPDSEKGAGLKEKKARTSKGATQKGSDTKKKDSDTKRRS